MFDVPELLPDDAIVDGFTPDATLAWLATYAGPCGDPACDKDKNPDGHTRLYMIPIIGWLHVILTRGNAEEFQLRPAIMASGGSVIDYMRLHDSFKFIAILRATEDAAETAKQLYKERHGGSGEIVLEHSRELSN